MQISEHFTLEEMVVSTKARGLSILSGLIIYKVGQDKGDDPK